MSTSRSFWTRWPSAARWVVIIGACTGIVTKALAFAPGGGVHWYPFTKTHAEITEEALETVYASVGLTTITISMKEARKEFVEANKAVDGDQYSSALHFDGENFAGGQTTINQNLSTAVTQAKGGDFSNARKSVGAALHTVQDFYAHSNWIELGNSSPSAEVGRPGAISNTAGITETTCAKVLASCNVSNLITTRLTSGYYGGEDIAIQQDGRTGKCRHGGYFDIGPDADGSFNTWFIDTKNRQALPGINKDSSVCVGGGYRILDSPHSDYNPTAKEVAVKATVQVFDDLKTKLTAGEFRSLLGIPSLAFAIDTTGSMSSIIAGVRASAIAIVDARLSTVGPSKYVLSPFNDPTVGPATWTTDPCIL